MSNTLQPKLISCKVMVEEIEQFLPSGIEVEIFEISLHTRPKLLRETLQKAVSAADGKYDPIILGYGMCSQALVGLTATQSRLVMPKTDDCIGIFLGSQTAYRLEQQKEPGTYFLSSGWIGAGNGSVFDEYDRMRDRYGEDRANSLMDRLMAHYHRLVYIRMPGDEDVESERDYARRIAAQFDLEYVEIDGTPKLLHDLIAGLENGWDDRFVTVSPGEPIGLLHFRDAFRTSANVNPD